MSQEVSRPAVEEDTLLDDARYWFDQYRFAAGWEARLIREIHEMTGDRPDPRPKPKQH